MLKKKEISDFLNNEFRDSDYFLVEVLIKPGNVIKVFVDKPEGITIQECHEISRKITGRFDRDSEDYSLDVSSPGLDMPLVVRQQYEKNIGREVAVELNDGKKRKGLLKAFNNSSVTIEEKTKQNLKDKNIKKAETQVNTINKSDIKTVKVIISFK